MSVSRRQIVEWRREGWTFRLKEVKGRRYISRRKGGEERGLGRYDEGLWRLIQDAEAEPSEQEEYVKTGETIGRFLKQIRVHHMSSSCLHIDEGFCTYWRYGEMPGFFNIADIFLGEGFYREVVRRSGPSYWVFRAERFYCDGCPAFRSREKSYVLL